MRVFLVAGEPSGDKLGAALMVGLKELCPNIVFSGVGGPLMQAEGMQSLFEMSELSVMGLAEVLPKYPALRARMVQTADAVLAQKPVVLITIDSPDFSLRVAKRVKAASDIRTVHYVAPTVWAWRPGRAAKMAKMIDHVLALFPFEPPLMQAHGMECDFVGHPVVAEPVATDHEVQAFREAHGLANASVMLVLPGSRRGEVARLVDVFGASISPILAKHPDLRVVVPAAAAVADEVTKAVSGWPAHPIVLDPREGSVEAAALAKRAAFRAADVALAASGTVSLELAAAGTPMVIAYRMTWLSQKIISAMALIDTATLVNIVSDTRAVPEFLADRCRPELIGPAVLDVLANPEQQTQAMDVTMDRLGQGGEDPGLRAARAVLDRLPQS